MDIFESIQAIRDCVADQSFEQFSNDLKTQDAVLRRLLVIGEASTRRTPETRASLPLIPFQEIAGLRNRVVRDYGHLDLDVISGTIQDDLPLLRKQIQPFVPGQP